jgi:hypothetical protein
MERAGKLLGTLKLTDKVPADELARAAWIAAVGKRLAQRATATTLVRDRLVVEVEDAIWQKQLFHLRHQILEKLKQVIGEDLIRDLEFRIAPPRRPLQPATRLNQSADEAEQIEDSVLRYVYKQARKKATA